MALSTDVTLPRDVEPEFPDSCVGCGLDAPGRTWSFAQRTSSWLGLFGLWIGRRHVVQVPCCADCEATLRTLHRKRFVWTVVVTIVALIAIMPALQYLDRPFRKPAAVVLVLVALSPTILMELFRPPAFDLFVRRDTVDYEFADAGYAQAFHALNEDAGATIEH